GDRRREDQAGRQSQPGAPDDGGVTLTEVALHCLNPGGGEPVRKGDRFCEVCGQELLPTVTMVKSPPAARSAANGTATAVRERDDDGASGVRRDRDHVEMWFPGVAGV